MLWWLLARRCRDERRGQRIEGGVAIMDFSKFKMPKERTIVRYRREKCGREDEYVIELPEDLRKHQPDVGRCGGRLVEVSRRTEPR